MSPTVWQVLDVNSIWMKEFASSLAKLVPTSCWSPAMRFAGIFESWEQLQHLRDPALDLVRFPLQRGYSREPLRWLYRYENALLARMTRRGVGAPGPLICSTPFYAPLAERWDGPVIYYVTDLTAEYESADRQQVLALDRRMCQVAHAVCPNSSRIADYLVTYAGCAPEKITVVPNATRASNLARAPLLEPDALPPDLAHLSRPIAGVIGNLAENMDWELLAATIEQTPDIRWVFVGPTSMPIRDLAQSRARAQVMRRANFTGTKPYGELQSYARCFDVAVLPYCKREPTYSGSSTRFYEHLAACRPMLATRGFAELLTKPPLLELVDTASELAQALARLQAIGFRDGYEILRWEASRTATWDHRARTLVETVPPLPAGDLHRVAQRTMALVR